MAVLINDRSTGTKGGIKRCENAAPHRRDLCRTALVSRRAVLHPACWKTPASVLFGRRPGLVERSDTSAVHGVGARGSMLEHGSCPSASASTADSQGQGALPQVLSPPGLRVGIVEPSVAGGTSQFTGYSSWCL